MYYIIWEQASDELCATVKSISGFFAAVYKFDAIIMLKIIQKAMFNAQGQIYFLQQYIWLKGDFTEGYKRKDKMYKNTMKSLKKM